MSGPIPPGPYGPPPGYPSSYPPQQYPPPHAPQQYPSPPYPPPPHLAQAYPNAPLSPPHLQPYGPLGGPPFPTRPRRRRGIIALVVVGALIVVAAVATGVTVLVVSGMRPSDAEQIATVTKDFVRFDDTNQTHKAAACLCAEQAELYVETAQNEQLAATDDAVEGSGAADGLRVRAVTVRGDTASAEVSGKGDAATTLYYAREHSSWKICDSAEKEFTASGGT